MKRGAPTIAVMLPTGSSAGMRTVRARVSERRRKRAPARME